MTKATARAPRLICGLHIYISPERVKSDFVMDLFHRRPPVDIKLIVLQLTGVSHNKFILDGLPPVFSFFPPKLRNHTIWLEH